MTRQASQYMQAESYEESMESMLQLEENTYDTQNTSQLTARRCAQWESLTYKLMQPTDHCFIWRDEQETVFYTSIAPRKHKRDSHASDTR